MEDPGESWEIKYRLARPGSCGKEASWDTALHPEEPSLPTPDGGASPPRGLTLSSERLPCHSLAISAPRLPLFLLRFHLYLGLYYTVLERNVVREDLCGLGCVVPL